MLDVWGREALLVFHLSGRWSKPVDFDDDGHAAGGGACRRLPRCVSGRASRPRPKDHWKRFSDALEDDFNTPAALAVMHEWRDHELLRRALEVFGLESLAEADEVPPDITELAGRRQAAREARDFDEADRLRAELETAGWEVRDEPGGYRLVQLR